MRRVVVTGVGLISPLGTGRASTWSGLLEGRSGIAHVDLGPGIPPSLAIAGLVPDFAPEHFFSTRELRRLDRFLQFALVASDEALSDAGLPPGTLQPDRAGVYIGSGIGGLMSLLETTELLRTSGLRGILPFSIPRILTSMAPGTVAIRHGFKGPCMSHVSACASGTQAIGEAFRVIRHGYADVMLAGATEAAVTALTVSGFEAMRALAHDRGNPSSASRPFERDRRGFVLGEGAAVLFLEELSSARRRGARCYAELTGYGTTCDASHITLPPPDGEGASRCMRLALEDAHISPDQIDYVSAHGTGTRHNDLVETRALHTVFGPHAASLWVSSIKSMTGHLLGASGALEAAVCALSLASGQVPPTINFESRDPDCDLDYVPNVARAKPLRAVLDNSFAFGGTNATLVLQQVRS